ncbi:phosphoribosylformylglycinamidine cyclo-ligase [Nitrospina watsonii]|uniref:Phosphoribosylformylglycinamidine cyclo-ligase n=1 Tax=Nitrospina watsonii TaxID=1323948 RepID=A0ABM9HAR5_9BACT|nr:phosphoribosylformylglycinamidine cyclo-ligase [Nitrospina watsonii]CAI2717206.1 Phosphoribosylformylglycinamidine cyclo-ligase [Nitrospina watsonii]
MPNSNPAHTSKYEESGVSQTGAETALGHLLKHVLPTRQFNTQFPVKADIGYFANVIDLGNGQGVALCTDGVGTKMRVAELLNQYDTIGIDCVAMNVNDLICIGARPISMVDYIACSHIEAHVFDQLGQGLAEGARQAGISISGGEISQIGEIITGIDLIGAALGHIHLDRINTGQHIQPGNLILGLAASGVHSNGLTLARRVLLGETPEMQQERVHQYESALDRTLGAELLEPTRIYVQPVLEMFEAGIDLKALVHITGGGLLNLLRVQTQNIRFVIDPVPDVPPVFSLIQQRGDITDAEMYEVFNMGVGFCIVVEHANDAEAVQKICKQHSISCHGIGYVETTDAGHNEVVVPSKNLIGSGSRFSAA